MRCGFTRVESRVFDGGGGAPLSPMTLPSRTQAAVIALMRATSHSERSSSRFTPLGNWADSLAGEASAKTDAPVDVVGCCVSADGIEAAADVASAIATTGSDTDAELVISLFLTGAFTCRFSRTHLLNWVSALPSLERQTRQ